MQYHQILYLESTRDDIETQRFLYEAGRVVYERDGYKPIIFKENEMFSGNIVRIESQEAFMIEIHHEY